MDGIQLQPKMGRRIVSRFFCLIYFFHVGSPKSSLSKFSLYASGYSCPSSRSPSLWLLRFLPSVSPTPCGASLEAKVSAPVRDSGPVNGYSSGSVLLLVFELEDIRFFQKGFFAFCSGSGAAASGSSLVPNVSDLSASSVLEAWMRMVVLASIITLSVRCRWPAFRSRIPRLRKGAALALYLFETT